MQRTPAGALKQLGAAARHAGLDRAPAPPRRRPGIERRAEARARPVDHLHRAVLRRRIGEGTAKRAQGLGIDPGKRRQLDREAARAGVDIEFALLVEGAPGQQVRHRRRHLRRRPRLQPGRALEQVDEAARAGTAGSASSTLVHDPPCASGHCQDSPTWVDEQPASAASTAAAATTRGPRPGCRNGDRPALRQRGDEARIAERLDAETPPARGGALEMGVQQSAEAVVETCHGRERKTNARR